jgi:transcriptional regulator with XRE-family HTH domain
VPKRTHQPLAQESFGRRLARLRKQEGLTQQQLGDAVGISRRNVAYYEGQTEHPPAALLPRFAEVLGTSIEALLGVEALRPSPEAQDRETRRLWKKLQQIRTLSERDQRAIIRVINSFITTTTKGQGKAPARKLG